jgi:hypothetical protein
MSFLTVTIWILGVFPSNNGRLITRFLENLYWHGQLIPTKIDNCLLVFGKFIVYQPTKYLGNHSPKEKNPSNHFITCWNISLVEEKL